MDNRKVIYYKDELNDEFSTAQITPRVIDEKYKYKRGIFWNACSYIVQNVLSMPVKIGYSKLKFRIKYIGKEKVKPYKNTGYFIYVNHTQPFGDTHIPSLAIYPKRNFFIVNPENVSIKPWGWLIELLGAIPIPGNKKAMKNFMDVIKDRIQNNSAITIYPEAHIWPYYTKIRPFKAVSFTYPAQMDKPVFCMTNTYQRVGNKEKAKIVTYIDGPFFANKEFTSKEQKLDLRNRVYETMCERSKNSNIEIIEYRPEE
jgi:1-acyl-sn-glycerol-3-phosphate acyltransferase